MNGRDSYGVPAGFAGISSVGSSHNRLTSAEDYEEALLSGYPPVGLLDAKNVYHAEQKGNRRGLRSPWGQIYGTIATTVPGGVLQRLQHPNFANPGAGASSPGSFGDPQFALKLYF